MLLSAAIILIFIGLAHSYLGEKYILIRLFERTPLPKLNGGTWYTKRILRYAWHLTTLAWWGFAALLLIIEYSEANLTSGTLIVSSVVFGISGLVSLILSKGKHIAWPLFLAVSVLSYLSL